MSGKRQHYVMRLLLDGFAYRVKGDEQYVWCFREKRPPFSPNTKNVGLESDFYGESGVDTLDEFITNELETKHSSCVTRIRQDRQVSSAADKDILIDFVHTSALRTRNLRDILATGTEALFSQFYSVLDSAESVQRQMSKEREQGTIIWKKAISSHVQKTYGTVPRQQRRYLERQAAKEARRRLLGKADAHMRQQVELFRKQITEVGGQLEDTIKTSHNKVLREGLQSNADDPSPRYNYYRQLQWQVQSVASGALILGDVAVLQFQQQSGKFSAAYDGIKGDGIFLPLSHNLLVIGTSENAGLLPSLDQINRASARLSSQFFVSFQNSERERNYHHLLGSSKPRIPNIFTS